MKRTPLLRKTRLKARRGRKRRVAATRVRSEAPKHPKPSARRRDTEYMLRVKRLPCCGPGYSLVGNCVVPWACSFLIEAHHAGKRAAGRKADDDTCIPLCSGHHLSWHNAKGPFYGWTREQRRTWADQQIQLTRSKLAGQRTGEGCPF